MTNLKYFVLHINICVLNCLKSKVFRLTRTYSERQARNSQQSIFRKVWTRYIQNFDQFLINQKKMRLGFLVTDLSQTFWNMSGDFWTEMFCSWIRGDLNIIVNHIQNFDQKLPGLIISSITQLNSLFVFLAIQQTLYQ